MNNSSNTTVLCRPFINKALAVLDVTDSEHEESIFAPDTINLTQVPGIQTVLIYPELDVIGFEQSTPAELISKNGLTFLPDGPVSKVLSFLSGKEIHPLMNENLPVDVEAAFFQKPSKIRSVPAYNPYP